MAHFGTAAWGDVMEGLTKGKLLLPAKVPPVSKPAVSPMSPSAAGYQVRVRAAGGMRVWKLAMRQALRPAVQQRESSD